MKYITFIILINIALSAYQIKAEPVIRTKYVYSRGGESLAELLEHGLGISKSIINNNNYLKKIKKWNPSITNSSSSSSSSSLSINQRVYIEVPFRTSPFPKEYLSPHKINSTVYKKKKSKKPTHNIKKKVVQRKRKRAKKRRKKKGISASPLFAKQEKYSKNKRPWNFSLFYAYSKGVFEESVLNSIITTSSNQDSPLTLGLSSNKKINSNYSYSGSFYFSTFDKSISDQGESLSIPPELGFNSYLQYSKREWPAKIYGGLDLESFSSFNTEELSLGEALSIRQHKLFFLTLGASKVFHFFDKNILAKVSLSQSITSSQSRPSLVNPETFKGTKFIIYLNMKANKKWFYHVFYKQHNLVGATQLNITRLGIGFGYLL